MKVLHRTVPVMFLLALLTLWFKVRARKSYREIRVKLARINAYLQEHITGMSVVQIFTREAGVFDEFSRHLNLLDSVTGPASRLFLQRGPASCCRVS